MLLSVVDMLFWGNGVTFNRAEQWMMWNKAKTFHDDEIAEKFLEATEQAEIKALGRVVHGFDSKVWDAAKRNIVVRGNSSLRRIRNLRNSF